MPVTVALISEALKRLRAAATGDVGESSRLVGDDAAEKSSKSSKRSAKVRPSDGPAKEGGADSNCPSVLWRGLAGIAAGGAFKEQGGSELAPMSTTSNLDIAIKYSRGRGEALIFKLNIESFMSLGADLTYLSAFPHEREFLYPPLTFLQPLGKPYTYVHEDGSKFIILEVSPTFPS